jgi:hypothetical protein
MSPLYGYIATAPIRRKTASKLVAIHADHELDFSQPIWLPVLPAPRNPLVYIY